MLTISPLTLLNELSFHPREKVYVVSDSQYASYKRTEAEKSIAVLQARADEHTKALATITLTIDELKKEHGITDPATAETQ